MNTEDDTFRRLSRLDVERAFDTIVRGDCSESGLPQVTLERFLHKCDVTPAVSSSNEKYLSGTGWTLPELNDEIERLYRRKHGL